MLILLLIIGLLVLAIGIYGTITKQYFGEEERKKSFIKKFKYACECNDLHFCINATAIVLIIVFSIALIVVGAVYSSHIVINDKISLYEEENNTIETNITEIVEQYKDYEQSTFEKCKTNPTIALEIYPELKSNDLVTKQIEVYVENNKKIKKLKEKRLNYKVLAWWIYFG